MLCKIHKGLLQLSNQKTTWLKHGPKTLTNTSPKRIFRCQVNIMKRCSTSYVIREMQMKMRCHYTPIRMAKIWNTDNTKCWRGCGATGTFIHCWWEWKMVQSFCKTVWWFLTKLNILFFFFTKLNILTIRSSNLTPWYLPKEVENLYPQKKLAHRCFKQVYS